MISAWLTKLTKQSSNKNVVGKNPLFFETLQKFMKQFGKRFDLFSELSY